METTRVIDIYTEFSRIDLDARGGYARVAQVKANGGKDPFRNYAFKLMRHDLVAQEGGKRRFESELKTLLSLTSDPKCPSAITKVFDSGFASVGLSEDLQKPDSLLKNFKTLENIDSSRGLISTGLDLKAFLDTGSALEKTEPHQWLPYIVVELATYEDSLLRQIRHQSYGNINNNLHKLPVSEIVIMAIRLLEALDYLHNNHKSAYMDWKPEHIYWDGASRRLKLIDWNVSNMLENEKERKTFIREDIRLFCGAALYCSLALNDPEDQKRPVGTPPKNVTNPSLSIQRRYWTDNPIFYERDLILDKTIKQIVKMGLDPKQGFNSANDLKIELIQYAKTLGLSEKDLTTNVTKKDETTELLSSDKSILQNNNIVDAKELLIAADDAYFASEYDRAINLYLEVLRLEPGNERAANHLLIAKSSHTNNDDSKNAPPRDAIQLYRRARSYIPAGDFKDAQDALTSAVNISRKKGVRYPDAEQLLKSVEDRIAADDYKNKATLAVKDKNWNIALNLYYQALTKDPTNTITSQDALGIQNILQAKSDELQKGGVLSLFGNLRRLRIVTKAAKSISTFDNSVINNLEKKLDQISLLRSATTTIVFVGIVIVFYFTGIPSSFYPGSILTNTPVINLTLPPTITATSFTTETLVTTIPTKVTNTKTATIAPTDTLTPTSTEVTLGIGYINKLIVSAWKEPNKDKIATLGQNQPLILLEQKTVSNSSWFRCRWELNNTTFEGWILAEYIILGTPPTPGS